MSLWQSFPVDPNVWSRSHADTNGDKRSLSIAGELLANGPNHAKSYVTVCTLDLIKVRHSSRQTAVNTVQCILKMGRDWVRPMKIWANAQHWCSCTGACRRGACQRGCGRQRARYKTDTVVWAKSCCQNNYSNVTFTTVSFPMWTPCFEKKVFIKVKGYSWHRRRSNCLCFMLLNDCSHLAVCCAMQILPHNCSTSEAVAIVIDSYRQITYYLLPRLNINVADGYIHF